MITQRLHADIGSPWSVLQGLLLGSYSLVVKQLLIDGTVQCCGEKAILFLVWTSALWAGKEGCVLMWSSRWCLGARVPSPPQWQTRGAARILCFVLLQVIIFPSLFFRYFPMLKSAVCAPKKGNNGKCSALLILCVSCCPTELGAGDQTYACHKLFGKLSWVFSPSLLCVSV